MASTAKQSTKRSSRPAARFADRYEIVKKLGQGGGGEVLLAHDLLQDSKLVALKTVPLKKKTDPHLVATLKNEFATLTLLRHRNLAAVMDFGTTPEAIYFSSEWVDGKDILQALHASDLNTVFKLLVEVMRAVDYLHRRGVLHLDLKPGNILITDPNRTGELTAKVIDFGLAKWNRQEASPSDESSGTPPYAAPEVLLAGRPTPASDTYSLGMLFHWFFTGRYPFKSQNPFEIMGEQVQREALPVARMNPALPESFKDLLEKSVRKNPSERFQNVHELLEALNRCLDESFTLRSSAAPLKILEESDFFFRPTLLEDNLRFFEQGNSEARCMSGPRGIGKTRFLRRLKEILQLQGKEVLMLEQGQDFGALLSEKNLSLQALILDDWTFDREQQEKLQSFCSERKICAFTAGEADAMELNPIPIPPLQADRIDEFLRDEIADFPLSGFGSALALESAGLPSRLEELLQALREEGSIQWTFRGWHWVAKELPDPAQLLVRRKARWEGIRRRVEGILSRSTVGLSGETLEGMLHLESGALAEKLSEWKLQPGNRSAGQEKLETPERDRPSDWLETELTKLYENDELETGIQWSRWALSEGGLDLSPLSRLYAARHLVSMGYFQEAATALPSDSPKEADLAGLYHEISGRILLSKSLSREGFEAIGVARENYRLAEDQSGVARAFNLEGFFLKQQLNYEAAEAAFEQAMKAARGAPDPYLESVARMNLGTLFQDRGQFERAFDSYHASLEVLGTTSHHRHWANLKHNWINLLFHMGKLAEAETACYDLLEFSIQRRFLEHQGTALNYLALMAGKKSHQELQLKYFEQALAIVPEDRLPYLAAQLRINRGYVLASLEKFTAAQLDAEQALTITERHPHNYLRSMALLFKGKVLRDRPKPDLEASEALLKEAESLIEQSQNRQLQLDVHFELALLYKQSDRQDLAKRHLDMTRSQLEALLAEMPERLKANYLRDRKLDRIQAELDNLS